MSGLMKKILSHRFAKACLGVVFLAGAASSVQAEMLYSDWESINDNKAILHYETGIEWMRLAGTKGLSYNDALAEMGTGGRFEGWRFPTKAEVTTLMTGFYGGLGTGDDESRRYLTYTNGSDPYWNSNNALKFVTPMGTTRWVNSNGSYLTYSLGVFWDEETDSMRSTGVRHYNWKGNPRLYEYIIQSNVELNNWTKDSQSSYYSLFLVSDGGVTLTSKNDPTFNINNPNAPINQVPVIGFGALGLLFLAGRKKVMK